MLLLVMGARLSAQWALAAEPRMDYWYRETLKLGEVELPAGVEIVAPDPFVEPRAYLALKNQNATPVYVMSLSYKDVLVMITPDPNWKGRVNGAHEAASYLVAPNHPVTLNMQALTDLDKNLEDRNVLSSDPPPNDAPIPAIQSSELLLVYGEQVIEVPFTLSYSLNTNFDNGVEGYEQSLVNTQSTGTSTATQVVAERARREIFVLIGLAGVTILAISGWLIWKGLSRNR